MAWIETFIFSVAWLWSENSLQNAVCIIFIIIFQIYTTLVSKYADCQEKAQQ